MECASELGVIAAGAGALPGARRRCEAGKRTPGPGPRACLALLAAAALLALAAPAQAQTEVWSATLTTGDLSSGILGCSNGVGTARCSSTSVLSEDSFTYDSTAYNITGLFVRSNGQLEFIVDVDLTTTTLADLTLVVGSTSLVLSGGTASGTVKLIFSSSGVSLTAGTDIAVKLTAPGTPNTAAMGAPTITGTAQVGKTLTAVTTGITDADGLTSATYTYQWIRVDGTDEEDISGENSSTYDLVAADLGKTIKVKVSFTDDASHAETLTSAAYPSSGTVAAAGPNTAPDGGQSNTVTISGEDRAYLALHEGLDVTAGEALLVDSGLLGDTAAAQALTIADHSIQGAALGHVCAGRLDQARPDRRCQLHRSHHRRRHRCAPGLRRQTMSPPSRTAHVDGVTAVAYTTFTFNGERRASRSISAHDAGRARSDHRRDRRPRPRLRTGCPRPIAGKLVPRGLRSGTSGEAVISVRERSPPSP